MNRPDRSLAVVSASLPQVCDVCHGQEVVLMIPVGKPHSITHGVTVPHGAFCLHCTPVAGAGPVPIYIYEPYQGDLPGGTA